MIIQATLNNKQSAKFIVDTGASFTMISSALARDLAIDTSSQNQQTMPFQTANGLIQAPLTNLDSITVGGMEIKNLTAAVHDVVPDSASRRPSGTQFPQQLQDGHPHPKEA